MIESIRDILTIVYLGLGILLSLIALVFSFLIYKSVRRLLRLAKDTLENIRDLADTAVEEVARPLADTASAWSQIGSVVGFLTGISGRRRRRQRERNRDRNHDRKERRSGRDGDTNRT